MLVCKMEDIPAAHSFSCLPGARKKLVSQSSWKNTWPFTQGRKFAVEQGYLCFHSKNHLGIQLFKILWLALSWVTGLHKNREAGESEERLAVKMLVSTDWPPRPGAFSGLSQLGWSSLRSFPVWLSLKIHKCIGRRERNGVNAKESAVGLS